MVCIVSIAQNSIFKELHIFLDDFEASSFGISPR